MLRPYITAALLRVLAKPGDWFFKMSTEHQKEYIAEHEGSKYAPYVGKKAAPKGGVPDLPKKEPVAEPKPEPKPEPKADPKPAPVDDQKPAPNDDAPKRVEPDLGKRLATLRKKYQFYADQLDEVSTAQDKIDDAIDRLKQTIRAKRQSDTLVGKAFKMLLYRGGKKLKALKQRRADLKQLHNKLYDRFQLVRKTIKAVERDIKLAKKKARK